jgi:hypothetical protein
MSDITRPVAGQWFTFDDGRPNHRVRAVVISVAPDGFVAQFADRADTTTIRYQEREWMDYIKFDERPAKGAST